MSYWIIGDRQSGKTTAALKWFMLGQKVDYFPGWSRVFVMSHGEPMRSYVKDLLSKLWRNEGRTDLPPSQAIITPHELFSPQGIRGRSPKLEYVIDEFNAGRFMRIYPEYNAVISNINVEVFTRDGFPPYPGELTPDQFIDLLNGTATEEYL